MRTRDYLPILSILAAVALGFIMSSAHLTALAIALFVYRCFERREPRRWFQFPWWAPLVGSLVLAAVFVVVTKLAGGELNLDPAATAVRWIGTGLCGALVGAAFGFEVRADRYDAKAKAREGAAYESLYASLADPWLKAHLGAAPRDFDSYNGASIQAALVAAGLMRPSSQTAVAASSP